MNIDDRKTALDDDSLLYQKRDESFGKKDTSSLNAKQKAGYFKDYYLKALIAAAAVIAIVGSVLYTAIFHRSESLLGVAFVDKAYLLETDALNDYMRDILQPEHKQDYIDLSNYDLSDYGSQIRFTTLTAAGSIDIIICDEECFDKYSQMGYFADLSEFLPAELYEKVKDQIVESSETETDEEGNITKMYPAAPHGINISGNALYKDFGGTADQVILGVFANTERTDMVLRFIEHLLSYEAGEAVPAK